MQEEQHDQGRSVSLQKRAPCSLAFFGHDAGESTIIKRVTAFQAHGCKVLGFMFRRERGASAKPPQWENVDLGPTVDRNYLRRVPKLAAAVVTVLQHRHALARCQALYARNIDMLLIALVSRRLTGSRALVVYEVLDVQRVFIGERPINKLFRWAERRMLGSCDLLVVSSPEFMSRYFQPCQGYTGQWRLLENKISPQQLSADRAPAALRGPPDPPPWIIGWFGRLRCMRSLDILCRIADRLGERVQIRLRGLPSEEDVPMRALVQACAARTNLTYEGEYDSRRDLPDMYAGVHFAWCVDYQDAGANSDWLLPNRIYEGGLFGALALARKNTATARKVEREHLGWPFAEPLDQQICDFLDGLEVEAYTRARHALEGADRSLFVDDTDTKELLEYLDACARQRGRTEADNVR
jgi:succinoglycan biosynthesis protein ExoL